MANIPSFKTELLNLFTTTSNLTATEKQKLRDRFVTAYSGDWAAYLAGGGTDTAANRGAFAVDKTVEFWQQIYRDQNRQAQVMAIVPETLG